MPVIKFVLKSAFGIMLCVYALQLDSTWTKNNQFTDLVTDKCLLDTVTGITLITCASRCSRHENCKSFFFNKGLRTCHHHATKFEAYPTGNNTYMVTQLGTSYFFNAEEKDSNISTPSQTVCAAVKCSGFTYLPAVNMYFKMAKNSTNSWDNATDQCIRSGGRLASPKDQRTVDSLERMIHTRMGGFENLKGFWVSARLNTDRNDFVWLDDNTTIHSSLWRHGKPGYFSKPGSDTECVIMIPMYNFKLADYKCNVSGDSVIALCECK